METKDALTVDQLTVNYGKTPALWDVTFSVPRGNIVGIVGPNGAGKSTLIKAVLGLVTPLSGSALFFGDSLAKVREKVAYVPQRESVDWDFPITVKELVLMGRYGRLGLFHRPKQADREAVKKYLEMVGMQGYEERQISELSGGQQQRVFLARALIQEAELYFMDEPFTGVDLATEKAIVILLHELKKEGKTVFVVHHDLNTVEDYFDWVMMLNFRLVACGTRSEVFTPENLNLAYGRSYALFDEALKLSQTKTGGFK